MLQYPAISYNNERPIRRAAGLLETLKMAADGSIETPLSKVGGAIMTAITLLFVGGIGAVVIMYGQIVGIETTLATLQVTLSDVRGELRSASQDRYTTTDALRDRADITTKIEHNQAALSDLNARVNMLEHKR